MNKRELILFNEAFSQIKVSGLGKDSSIMFFKLKIAVSEEITKIAEYEKLVKEQTKPDDVQDENNLSDLQLHSWKNAFEEILTEYQRQEVENFPDTHILTEDELYDCILSSELNREMNTEKKSILMKFLLK